MPSFKELVTVVSPGHHTGSPNGGQSEVMTSAWAAWQQMLNDAQELGEPEVPGAEPGVKWVEYHGTLAHTVIRLGLASPRDVKAYANVRREIGRWLRWSGNAVCLESKRTGGGLNASRWALRSEFRETAAPADLPVMTMISSALAHADAPSSAQPAPQAAPQHTSQSRADCPYCGIDRAREHMGRHVFTTHASARELLVTALRQRGRLLSTELKHLLSAAAGGAPVSAGFVTGAIASDVAAGLITRDQQWAGQIWYAWAGDPAPAVTPQSEPPAGGSLNGSGPLPAAAAAGTEPGQRAEPPGSPAAAGPVLTSPAERAGAGSALTEALGALEDAVQQVRSSAAALSRENEQLREYRRRVRDLLGGTGGVDGSS